MGKIGWTASNFGLSAWLISIMAMLMLTAPHVEAIGSLVIKGNKFFNSETGLQFYIKGTSFNIPNSEVFNAWKCSG